ncbi:PfkB family carbohydrate kinase [Rathayibacter sp. YIM 133350]|uniref:PfkB family carbohydrate kinase n=1 Tax=Rathayibacter sp. YIM 133350 TaxID=3131992 RepID=UPI00307ECAA2
MPESENRREAGREAGADVTAGGRVLVVGDALIDELHDESGTREFVGGAGLNVAVGLAVLGVPSTLLAQVATDAAGHEIRSYLERFDVELLTGEAPNGTARAVSERVGGEPRYSFNEAARERVFDIGRAKEAIAAAPAVVVSCFPFDDAGQAAALAAATAGYEVIVDPNPRAGMMRDRGAFLEGFRRLAAGATLVKVGDEDAALLLGASLDDLEDFASAAGARAVLATAGAAGARVRLADGTRVDAPIAHLDGAVIDTMGAGDATLAASVRRIVNAGVPGDAEGWRELLDEAMVIAAATVRAEGALLRRPQAT